jgi:hypothetical protein
MLVSDLASRKVACSADVEQLIGLAEKNKTVKGTGAQFTCVTSTKVQILTPEELRADMNERSSRSHTVFQLRIKSRRGAELLQGVCVCVCVCARADCLFKRMCLMCP